MFDLKEGTEGREPYELREVLVSHVDIKGEGLRDNSAVKIHLERF